MPGLAVAGDDEELRSRTGESMHLQAALGATLVKPAASRRQRRQQELEGEDLALPGCPGEKFH